MSAQNSSYKDLNNSIVQISLNDLNPYFYLIALK